jgi:PhoH-like ATPase
MLSLRQSNVHLLTSFIIIGDGMEEAQSACVDNSTTQIQEIVVARKTFVIDTNVLVYDPSAMKRFCDNDLVVPLLVLEELDGLKRQVDEVGRNAREVMRYIDSLSSISHQNLREGVRLAEGPFFRLHIERQETPPPGFPLPLDRNSNRFLSVAYELKDKGEEVVVVSKDFVTRVKAEAMGIEAQDYEALKSSYEEVYRGIRYVEANKQKIDLFFKDGSVPEGLVGHLDPNEYVFLSAHDEANSSVLCRYNGRQRKLESLVYVKKDVWGIQPLNLEQRCAMDLLLREDIPLVTLMGQAGTGKTLLALACGMKKVFDDQVYSRILISRPIVPLGKDIGYLPGSKEEKLYHWMQPIYDNLEFLCTATSGEGNGNAALEFIMQSKKIEMEAVTYIRGRSLPKMYMIIDEAQNLTPHEVKTIISRAGKGTKVVLTGDPSQIDNPYLDRESNGLAYAVSRLKSHAISGHMFLDKTERSELASVAVELM